MHVPICCPVRVLLLVAFVSSVYSHFVIWVCHARSPGLAYASLLGSLLKAPGGYHTDKLVL